MKLYRYWARIDVDEEGRPAPSPGLTAAAGWSNESMDHAREVALERATRFAAWWRQGDERLVDRYTYSDRPMREPIIDELHRGGRRLAAITRNAYGAYVLNAAGALFADIDGAETPALGKLKNVWAAMRGVKLPTAEEALIERLRDVADRRGLGLRLYRTRAGHRALVTSATFEPNSSESTDLLATLGSDPLYMHLCAAQECYRARLSPKPWRIGVVPPAANMRYPWRDDATRARFDAWATRYEEATRAWGVCEHVATLGVEAVHEDVQPVLTLHDELGCAAGKPLA